MSLYSEKLQDPRWQKKRLHIFERDHWKCTCCGSATKTLQVHHLLYSKRNPWDAPDCFLETLCRDCHDFREDWNHFFDRSPIPTSVCYKLWSQLVYLGEVLTQHIRTSDGALDPQRTLTFISNSISRLRLNTGDLDPETATVAPLSTHSLTGVEPSASPSETPSEKVKITGGDVVNQQLDEYHRSPVTPGPCQDTLGPHGSGATNPDRLN